MRTQDVKWLRSSTDERVRVTCRCGTISMRKSRKPHVPDSVAGTLRVLHEAAGCNLPRWNPRLLLPKLPPLLHEPRANNASLSLRCKGGKGKKEAFPLPEGRLEPATLGVLACISWNTIRAAIERARTRPHKTI